jgi:hypothetical protein
MRPSSSLLAALIVSSVGTNGLAQTGTSPSAPPGATTPGSAAPPGAPPSPAAAPPAAAPPSPASVEPEPDAEPPGDAAAAPAGEAKAPPAKPAKPAPVPESDEVDEHGEPLPPLVPAAEDSVGGHFNLALAAAVALPFGNFEADLPATDLVGPGFVFNADAALGVSRSVFVGLWGQLALLGEGDDCAAIDASEDCKAKSYAGGVFVRYHLVQGVRFDPWMMAGLGYRVTKIEPVNVSYSGFEILKLAVGGDWYAASNFGIGALLELDMGVYSDRSEGSIGDASTHWQFVTGLRLVFDVPGK